MITVCNVTKKKKSKTVQQRERVLYCIVSQRKDTMQATLVFMQIAESMHVSKNM